MPFKSFDELRAACPASLPATRRPPLPSPAQDTLTKPQGSLGRLETIVAWLARWQGRDMPRLDKVKVVVFAGSHGVTAQGVSAFPAEVTHQMVANFAAGGAAINQLPARRRRRTFGHAAGGRPSDRRLHARRGDERGGIPGGRVDRLRRRSTRTPTSICFGEMGIGNTTTAAAIAAALFGGDAARNGSGAAPASTMPA